MAYEKLRPGKAEPGRKKQVKGEVRTTLSKIHACAFSNLAGAHIHDHNIIHGDNILVKDIINSTLILIEFGGSRLNGSPCLAGPSARYRLGGFDKNHWPDLELIDNKLLRKIIMSCWEEKYDNAVMTLQDIIALQN